MQRLEPPTSDGLPGPRALDATGGPDVDPSQELARVLLGGLAEEHVGDLPPIVDLTAAALRLAGGLQRKVLVPLSGEPLEWALVRSDEDVMVSLYGTGTVPEPILLERPVPLAGLLARCASTLDRGLDGSGPAEARLRLATRARDTDVSADSGRGKDRRRRCVLGTPETREDGHPRQDERVPALALGAELLLRPEPDPRPHGATPERSDAHALLFPGRLWASLRGRHVPLVDGPVVPALLRSVAVVRTLVDAWESDRTANVRLRAGAFLVAARRDKTGQLALTLGHAPDASVTITGIDVPEVAQPILRITSDVVRALVSVDRRQSRNLRVRTLRRELRDLRRRVRRRAERTGFTNADPDRLRASAPPPTPTGDASPLADSGPLRGDRLRFSERFRVEIEAIDASSTFACGDVIVAASPQRALAIGRDTGGLAWVREGLGGPSMMAGRTLVRIGDDGRVELCDVRDGEPFATTEVPELAGRPPHRAQAITGPDVPPTLALPVEQRIVGLDLRTGEPRWRIAFGQSGGPLGFARSGRVLLARCEAGALHAVDAATGDVVWRAASAAPYQHDPVVRGDRVLVVAGPGSAPAHVDALDLYTGRRLWRAELPGAPSASPIIVDRAVVVPERAPGNGGGRRHALQVVDADTGAGIGRLDDPGINRGGAATLDIDGRLVVNLPGGRVVGLDPTGRDPGWSRRLGDPLEDELPRRLEPVLRGGALFVPGAGVHVIRPSDGADLGQRLPSDLVPDFLRVDERGWVYVGEESGSLAAYAPVPLLRLVR